MLPGPIRRRSAIGVRILAIRENRSTS